MTCSGRSSSPTAKQRVLRTVPPYEISVTDVASPPPDEQAEAICRIRAEMDHQSLSTDTWPLFDIRAARIGDGGLHLFFSFDIMILDGLSLYLFFEDWRRFYEDPDWAPRPLELSYRDFVLSEERARETARYKRAEEYWHDRLDSLPPAPALPLAVQPSQLQRTEFTRRQARLPRERWAAVKRSAGRHGVTPSAVLMTAFAEVLRRWSAQPDFTLNLTLFNRPQAHPEIDRVIGDFTTLTMLEVRADAEASFAERAQRVQRQLMRDMEHLAYSGVRVQRERSHVWAAGRTPRCPSSSPAPWSSARPSRIPRTGSGSSANRSTGSPRRPRCGSTTRWRRNRESSPTTGTSWRRSSRPGCWTTCSPSMEVSWTGWRRTRTPGTGPTPSPCCGLAGGGARPRQRHRGPGRPGRTGRHSVRARRDAGRPYSGRDRGDRRRR